MLKIKFLPKSSVILILAFICFTIIGTLSHEFGHIAVAKYFGYDTMLDYGSMNYFANGFLDDENVKEIESISKDYLDMDYEEWPQDIKLKVEALDKIIMEKYPSNEISKRENFYITLGGPAQTLITSYLGLGILFFRRKKWGIEFKMFDWLAVFMSLFALREVFNFVQALYASIVYSKSNFHGDEFRISRYLGFNEWIIPTITFVLGLFISGYVIFKIIPVTYRFTFILSGLIGGISGFALWFGFLGETLFSL